MSAGLQPRGGQVEPMADGADLHVRRAPDDHAGDQHDLVPRVVGRGQGRLRGGTGGSGAARVPCSPRCCRSSGPGQRNLPVSLTFASVPLYTGGRLLRNIDAAGAQLGAQRSEEFRTAMDLKLTVAEAYVGVLRAQKNLEVARSNVEQLASFTRDVRNRREQGLAIRSDELAAEVSLANAQLAEIQARTALESAWATYNRYLCRPLTQVVPLEELTAIPPTADWKRLAEEAVREMPIASAADEEEVRDLTMRAINSRPELVGLTEQARGFGAQAEATRAGIRPQVGFSMGFVYLGSNNLVPQGIGAATFYADWTLTDSGATRRRAAAIQQQERATHQAPRGRRRRHRARRSAPDGSTSSSPAGASRSPSWRSSRPRRTSTSSPTDTGSSSARTPRSSTPRPAASSR